MTGFLAKLEMPANTGKRFPFDWIRLLFLKDWREPVGMLSRSARTTKTRARPAYRSSTLAPHCITICQPALRWITIRWIIWIFKKYTELCAQQHTVLRLCTSAPVPNNRRLHRRSTWFLDGETIRQSPLGTGTVWLVVWASKLWLFVDFAVGRSVQSEWRYCEKNKRCDQTSDIGGTAKINFKDYFVRKTKRDMAG